MKNILVTNDDGVLAPGLLALAQEMRHLGKVTILAPDRNWSGSGHVKTLDRALRMRAAGHGRSTEAEVRTILEDAVKPEGRLKLGSLLADIGRQIRLTDDEVALVNQRDKSLPRPMTFE